MLFMMNHEFKLSKYKLAVVIKDNQYKIQENAKVSYSLLFTVSVTL